MRRKESPQEIRKIDLHDHERYVPFKSFMFKNNNNNNKKALTSSVPNANLISSSAIFNYFQWHFELIFGHAFFLFPQQESILCRTTRNQFYPVNFLLFRFFADHSVLNSQRQQLDAIQLVQLARSQLCIHLNIFIIFFSQQYYPYCLDTRMAKRKEGNDMLQFMCIEDWFVKTALHSQRYQYVYLSTTQMCRTQKCGEKKTFHETKCIVRKQPLYSLKNLSVVQ